LSIDDFYQHFGAYGVRVLGWISKGWKLEEETSFVKLLSESFDARFIHLVRFCNDRSVTVWMKHKLSDWLDNWEAFVDLKLKKVFPTMKVVAGPLMKHPTWDVRTKDWRQTEDRPAFKLKLPPLKKGRKRRVHTSI
jgi:hypothetical protein